MRLDHMTEISMSAPTETVPAVVAWLRLLRVHHKMSRTLEESCRNQNMSLAQFDILAQVGSAEGMTQQCLADRLLVTKGNVCQLIDRMEQTQLITRRQQGRSNRLYLTPKGHQAFSAVVPAIEVAIAELLAGLSTGEQLELADLLRKLEHTIRVPERLSLSPDLP
jgi:DNA-binding MarR family transcriptional regulator